MRKRRNEGRIWIERFHAIFELTALTGDQSKYYQKTKLSDEICQTDRSPGTGAGACLHRDYRMPPETSVFTILNTDVTQLCNPVPYCIMLEPQDKKKDYGVVLSEVTGRVSVSTPDITKILK